MGVSTEKERSEMTGNDEEDVMELLSANERMGAALSYIYRRYPDLKAEVRGALFDYPWTFATVEDIQEKACSGGVRKVESESPVCKNCGGSCCII